MEFSRPTKEAAALLGMSCEFPGREINKWRKALQISWAVLWLGHRDTRQDSARPNANCVVAGLEGWGRKNFKAQKKERGCDDGLLVWIQKTFIQKAGPVPCHPSPSFSSSVKDLTVVVEQCCLLEKSVLISGHTEGARRRGWGRKELSLPLWQMDNWRDEGLIQFPVVIWAIDRGLVCYSCIGCAENIITIIIKTTAKWVGGLNLNESEIDIASHLSSPVNPYQEQEMLSRSTGPWMFTCKELI